MSQYSISYSELKSASNAEHLYQSCDRCRFGDPATRMRFCRCRCRAPGILREDPVETIGGALVGGTTLLLTRCNQSIAVLSTVFTHSLTRTKAESTRSLPSQNENEYEYEYMITA